MDGGELRALEYGADSAPEPAASKREEIVQAATRLIAERGYKRASLAQVAAQVGLTAPGLLHYFPSKDHLLLAVLGERTSKSASRSQPPEGQSEPTGDLASVLETLALTVEQNVQQPLLTQLHSVIVADSLTEGHAAKEPMRRRYREARTRVAAPLAADASLGGDVDRSPAIAALILAALDGLQIQWLLDPEAVDMQASFAVLEEALLGLRQRDADR